PEYEIAVTDLTLLDPVSRDAEILQIRAEMDHQVLPADRWPLFDVRACRLAGGRLRLHVSLDVLILDAFSLYLLFQDWRRFYADPTWLPEPLQLSYRDVVLAEEAERGSSRYASAERYWLSRMDELPAAPALPLATQAARLPRTEFTRRRARLSRDRWSAVKRQAQRRGLPRAVVPMPASANTLRLGPAHPDSTLNLTLFNRPPVHPQIGQLSGDFTAVTLLATQGQPGVSFAVRAEEVQRQFMQDLE